MNTIINQVKAEILNSEILLSELDTKKAKKSVQKRIDFLKKRLEVLSDNNYIGII